VEGRLINVKLLNVRHKIRTFKSETCGGAVKRKLASGVRRNKSGHLSGVDAGYAKRGVADTKGWRIGLTI